MALKDIIAKRREIPAPGGETFTVGAIDLTIAIGLFASREAEIKSLFDEAQRQGLTKNPDPTQIALMLLKLAPDFVAEAIAWAAGEPEAAPNVRAFPIGVQIEAIEAIFDLTFEAEGGVKKLGETVVRLLQKSTVAFKELNTTP